MKHLLLIPESRVTPLTRSRLYRKIEKSWNAINKFENFEVAFITIDRGILFPEGEGALARRDPNMPLPPRRFKSGRTWISKEKKTEMAKTYGTQLRQMEHAYSGIFIYARGSYLEAMQMAVREYNIDAWELIEPHELIEFKKKGWQWMKIGLRMPEVFAIFEKRIKEIEEGHFGGQVRLF
jgi:hypothetical protein